jgi:hypothetical protein
MGNCAGGFALLAADATFWMHKDCFHIFSFLQVV